MRSFVFGLSLLFNVLNTATPQADMDADTRPLILWNTSSPVLLPCSHPSPSQVATVRWALYNFSSSIPTVICTIDDKTGCKSPQFPHITSAKSDGFKTGNYSLYLTPNVEAAGLYYCDRAVGFHYGKKEMELVIINVSVTPTGPITLGTSVYLTSGIKNWSEYRHINWNIEATRVNANGFEILWTLNRQPIHADSNHSFDFRSLKIRNFQRADVGLYTYTVRSTKGNTCSYSRFLEISEPPKITLTILYAVIGVALVILAVVVVSCLVKFKYKKEGQKLAQVSENQLEYATLNLAALGNPGKYPRPPAENIVYADVLKK